MEPKNDTLPDGSGTLLDLAAEAAPNLNPADLHPLCHRIFGSPYATDWTPAPDQTLATIIEQEGAFSALTAQAWADRVEDLSYVEGTLPAGQVRQLADRASVLETTARRVRRLIDAQVK